MKYKQLKGTLEAYKFALDSANIRAYDQLKHIEKLEQQLAQQDKAIERKDMQFEGLKACYKDDLINGRLG